MIAESEKIVMKIPDLVNLIVDDVRWNRGTEGLCDISCGDATAEKAHKNMAKTFAANNFGLQINLEDVSGEKNIKGELHFLAVFFRVVCWSHLYRTFEGELFVVFWSVFLLQVITQINVCLKDFTKTDGVFLAIAGIKELNMLERACQHFQ